MFDTMPGKSLGIVSQDPSDPKSTWLHVDIFRFCFIQLRYILVAHLSMRSAQNTVCTRGTPE